MICENCKSKIPTLATRLRRVNEFLASLPAYHATLGDAFEWIDKGLAANQFAKMSESTSEAGTETSFHACVGENKWLHITWHRMPSGRYEVVSYVN